MANGTGTFLFTQLVQSLPQLLVCLVGLVLGILTWPRSKWAAGLAIAAALLMGLSRLGHVGLFTALMAIPTEGKEEFASRAMRMQVLSFVTGLMSSIGLGLLFVAAFIDRRPKSEDKMWIE